MGANLAAVGGVVTWESNSGDAYPRPPHTAKRVTIPGRSARQTVGLTAALTLWTWLPVFSVPARADPNALWRIVHGECVPHMEAGLGPKPCERVDLDGGVEQGVAILKDLIGVAQMLAIPTRRITGIEDPQMLAPDAPPVFADAWSAKTLVEERLHRTLPREAVGLAINSQWARSQQQLHVHVDCIAVPVIKALAEYASAFDSQWRAMTVSLRGRIYLARRVDFWRPSRRCPAQASRGWRGWRAVEHGRLQPCGGGRDL